MDPFNEEFETLLNTVATDIKVVGESPSYVQITLMITITLFKVITKLNLKCLI